jgi:hypothetical protein
VDPSNWVSVRLREAGNIVAGKKNSQMRNADRLLFEIADMAEKLEREGIDPIRDIKLSMLFCHATIFAAGVVVGEDSDAVV